ncbi:MAG: hypothetical protein IPK82_30735 [Polyangiaceae bacterium]|nr:hypothetical protein [Polyangiaceae bacterium]
MKYRNGTLDPKLSDTAVSLGEHQLVVYLRPHGAFGHGNNCKGLEWGFRQYLSVAAELGGIRFPASARDLKDTTQPTSYQLVAPSPGLLMSIEPWDYNTGTNPAHIGPLPLPIALQTGIHVTKIAEDDIHMSFLLGAALNVPLLENVSSQINTQATLGFYYENDFRGGNYFFMSLGFKLGSLFSGSSK